MLHRIHLPPCPCGWNSDVNYYRKEANTLSDLNSEPLVEPKARTRHIEKGNRFVWEIEYIQHRDYIAESLL
jgi:hypothetical protein